MAGRTKITDKRLQNIGLGKLQTYVKEEIKHLMDEEHPMALTKADQKALEELMALEVHERKEYIKGIILLNVAKLGAKLSHGTDDVPTRHAPSAMKMLWDMLKDIEGEPSQRIEVKKGVMTFDEFNELYKHLPKKTQAEDITDGELEGRETKPRENKIHSTDPDNERLGSAHANDNTERQGEDR
jgi:hypothetical protein